MDDMPIAYSYIRFSSDKQLLGDSLRRQVALAERYAAAHSLRLDTASYRDLGISAFRGRNAIQGKLSAFLSAIDGGLIKSDAYLLVESLDRLSRDDVDEALDLFLSIIRRGITIVTLSDGQLYNRASLRGDRGIGLIVSITIMMRANEESTLKSMRGKEAWRAKVLAGGIICPSYPVWLDLRDGRWFVRDKQAETIRQVFELALQGYGSVRISRMLNDAKVTPLGRASYWVPPMVTRCLSNPAVYGTLRRERAGGPPIEGYYPPIVPRSTFDAIRRIGSASVRANRSGTTLPRTSNLFRGVTSCAACQSPVFTFAGRGDRYIIQCRRAYARGGCWQPQMRGAAIEQSFFDDLLSAPSVESDTSPHAAFMKARYLAAALCGGRASDHDRAAIRAELQSLVGSIVLGMAIDVEKNEAAVTYRDGRASTLRWEPMPVIARASRGVTARPVR